MCNRFLEQIFGVISEEDPPPEVVSDPYSSVSRTHPQVGGLKELLMAYERLHQIPKFSPKESCRVASICNFQGFPNVCPCYARNYFF